MGKESYKCQVNKDNRNRRQDGFKRNAEPFSDSLHWSLFLTYKVERASIGHPVPGDSLGKLRENHSI